MKTSILYGILGLLFFSINSCKSKEEEEKNMEIDTIPEMAFFKEPYRPQFHFTPT
jgi:hypothetical protein